MSRNNSMVIKRVVRGEQSWTIMHNKFGNREQNEDTLDLIREWPNDKYTTGLEIIDNDFYNVRQCMNYIKKWHKENEVLRCEDCGEVILSGTLCRGCHYQKYVIDAE